MNKLTERKKAIKKMAEGRIRRVDIAEEYGLSKQRIDQILKEDDLRFRCGFCSKKADDAIFCKEHRLYFEGLKNLPG